MKKILLASFMLGVVDTFSLLLVIHFVLLYPCVWWLLTICGIVALNYYIVDYIFGGD